MDSTMSMEWFQTTLSRLQYAEQRWLPSWWLSSGLLEAAHPATARGQVSWHESLGFLATLVSTAMMLFLGLAQVGRDHYLAGYSQLSEMGSPRRRARTHPLDRALAWLVTPLPASMRLLLIKDLRVFRRDILQWSQVAIFFGLLVFYFLNVRRLQYGQAVSAWIMVVGFMNVGVVGLLLATFTTRFIYPLLSLEGRRFWILGTLPIHRRDILWSKFLFACGISLVPCALLIFLSDTMLQMGQLSSLVMVVHQWTCAVLCVGLSAIAVGFGARLPNLRDVSPAKIASGFGGTVTLVVSVVFILATVLATAIPTCYWVQSHQRFGATGWGAEWLDPSLGQAGSVLVGMLVALILGAIATLLPLRSGLRAFLRMEP